MTIKPTDITTLVEIFAASDWDELHVEIDGVQLFLSTDPNARLAHAASGLELPEDAGSIPRARQARADSAGKAGSAAPAKAVAAAPDVVPSHWVAVTAPNLGTFYRSPKPGAAPYVEEGQVVAADTEVCLLEVMKLFTAVRAGVAGIVRRICVNDAEMVEHGQPLLYIERT